MSDEVNKRHLKKIYEVDDVVCDMRSLRKKFFPVIKDNKQIAEIYHKLDKDIFHQSESTLFISDNLSEEDCIKTVTLFLNFINDNGYVYPDILSIDGDFPEGNYTRITHNNNKALYYSNGVFGYDSEEEMEKDNQTKLLAVHINNIHGNFTVVRLSPDYDRDIFIPVDRLGIIEANNISYKHSSSHYSPLSSASREHVKDIIRVDRCGNNRITCSLGIKNSDDFKDTKIEIPEEYKDLTLFMYVYSDHEVSKYNPIILPEIDCSDVKELVVSLENQEYTKSEMFDEFQVKNNNEKISYLNKVSAEIKNDNMMDKEIEEVTEPDYDENRAIYLDF